MTIFRDLPKDLAEEILCRVPATNLKRLRSTCKEWNRLFNNMSFARKHFDKAAKQFLALMLTHDYALCPMNIDLLGDVPSVEVKNELSLFDPDSSNSYQVDVSRTRIRYNISFQFDISRVFHCDGLLLCTSRDESRIMVWNPCTGQTRWIKAGNRGVKERTFVLGYCQDNNSGGKNYKILSYYCFDSKDGSEIYEFNSDSWRILDHDIAPGWSLSYSDNCVSLKGDTYVFATNETPTHIGLSLLRFDFATEKFVPVPLPCNWPSYVATSLSVVREEKLSVLLKCDDSSMTDIWLTNKIDETKVVSWSKVLELDLNGFDIQTSHGTTFLLDEEKKAVVLCDTWTDEEDETFTKDMVYLIEKDNRVTPVDLGVDTMDLGYPIILNYVPSLVQIEGAGGNKRKRGYNIGPVSNTIKDFLLEELSSSCIFSDHGD